MQQEELYFKDPLTGELKPDKRRSNEQILFTLAKINKQQEDTDKAIANQEKMLEARLGMFEQLLRSQLENACKDVANLKEDGETSNKNLIEKFKMYYSGAVNAQKITDAQQDAEIQSIKSIQTKHEARIAVLETAPVQQKAKYFDKVFWAVVGVGGAFLLTFLKNLLDALLKVGS